MKRVFLDKCLEAKCRENPWKVRAQNQRHLAVRNIAIYQLRQILNYKTDCSLVNFRCMTFQSTQKTTEGSGPCRHVYAGIPCRGDRTRNTQLPNADTIDFFLVWEKGGGGFVRTLRTPLGYVPEERQRECSQRRSEVRAGRLSSRFRLRAYRTVQTRPVSSRSVHHGIFPDVYFYTQSLQRPHERRPMASRREQVSALFFRSLNTTSSHRMFSMGYTEGPNPPKETLTFKKESFWQTTSESLPAGLKLESYSDRLSRTCSSTICRAQWLYPYPNPNSR